MRIATWNVNGVRARLEFLLRWLEERQPDIVGLQELKVTDEQFPRAELEAAGYQIVTHGQKSWNGVGVLARAPLTVVQSGLPGQEEFGARLITAEVNGLSFTTIYCPNGKSIGHDDFPRKLAWMEALAEHVAAAADGAAVLCGDFNVCPTALDSWNEDSFHGAIFHTDQERERYRGILASGYVDVFREQHPDRRAFSWWDYRGGAFHRGHGLRIDFLLASPAVATRVRSVEVDRDYRKKKDDLVASDHAPVIADLD